LCHHKVGSVSLVYRHRIIHSIVEIKIVSSCLELSFKSFYI